jgi:hypothetical protein
MLFEKLAYPEGFEPPTSWSVAKRSIQLSYGYAEQQPQSVANGGTMLNWERVKATGPGKIAARESCREIP